MIIQIFRVVAFLEGLSFIVLLGIAMPLKYIYEHPEYVKIIGMVHGLLFIGYVLLLVYGHQIFKRQFNLRIIWKFYLASILPFGTFYMEYKFLKNN